MSGLEIHWPDAAADEVTKAIERIEIARETLARRSHDEVVEAVAQAFEGLRDANAEPRRTLQASLPAATGFSPSTIESGLQLGLHEWTGTAVRALVHSELGPLLARGHRLDPFERIAVVLAGSIPMPSLHASLLPLLVGAPALVKSASRERVSARVAVAALREVDAELAACIEVIDAGGDDESALSGLLTSPCIVASGSDETLQAISGRLSQAQRFVGYGHRFSAAVISAEHVGAAALDDAGRALALDAALWDQSGCLSPICVWVVGDESARAAESVAEACAAALDEIESEMPRGPVAAGTAAHIRGQRDEADMRAAGGRPVRVLASDGTRWTVVLEADAALRPAPLNRFVRIHPAKSLAEVAAALEPHRAHLSTIGHSGFPREAFSGAGPNPLAKLGASRLCPLGRMQAPPFDWPHDGRPVLSPLARWTALETR